MSNRGGCGSGALPRAREARPPPSPPPAIAEHWPTVPGPATVVAALPGVCETLHDAADAIGVAAGMPAPLVRGAAGPSGDGRAIGGRPALWGTAGVCCGGCAAAAGGAAPSLGAAGADLAPAALPGGAAAAAAAAAVPLAALANAQAPNVTSRLLLGVRPVGGAPAEVLALPFHSPKLAMLPPATLPVVCC